MALLKPDPVAAHIARLEAENDELRERIRQYEEVISIRAEVPFALGLSASEGKLLGLLYRREMVTKDAAMVTLYGGRTGTIPDEAILNVLICRIRRKLKDRNVEILTLWGRGWRMPQDSKKIFESMFL